MAYEQRDMSGSSFPNDKRQKDTHAHYTGNGMIFGREVWINVWIKNTKDGREYLSFSFKEKEGAMPAERPVSGVPSLRSRFEDGPTEPAPGPAKKYDDEIPF